MKKSFIIGSIVIVLAIAGFFALNSYIYNEKQATIVTDHENAEDSIEEEQTTLDAMTLGMKTWVWQRALYNDGREILPTRPDVFTLTFADDGSFSVTTDCNSAGGTYTVSDNVIALTDVFSTMMYCEGSQETEYLSLLRDAQTFHFMSEGELIFDLKYDSGTVTFK